MLKFGRKTFINVFAVGAVIFSSACQVYKMDIKQGNEINKEKLAKLKVGMSDTQVEKLLGSPSAIPVLDTKIFEYHYSLIPGNGSPEKFQKATLYFNSKGKLYKWDNA